MKVARLLRRLSLLNAESLPSTTEIPGSGSDESASVNDTPPMRPADYSKLFGEEFRVLDEEGLDLASARTLDISVVEEALLHLLYACASQVRFSTSHGDVLCFTSNVQITLCGLCIKIKIAVEVLFYSMF